MVKLCETYCWDVAFEAESDGVVYVTDRGILLGPESLETFMGKSSDSRFLRVQNQTSNLESQIEAVLIFWEVGNVVLSKARDHYPFDPHEPRGAETGNGTC